MDIIYLDFEKAFGRVPFKRLLAKLQAAGIRGKLLKWIEEFLTGRTFAVRIGDTLSAEREVLSGVPQGSVLGPLLFTIYVADLVAELTVGASTFADDTKLFGYSGEEHRLQAALDAVCRWTGVWLLTLNEGKCSVLHCGRGNPRVKYHLRGTEIAVVQCQRDLGVLVSEDLKWGAQVSSVAKRANSLLYLVRKAFHPVSPRLLRSIYVSYVRSILEYACQLWSPYLLGDIALLEGVQRRAPKISGRLSTMGYEERLEMLSLQPLEKRRKRLDLIETFKIMNSLYQCPGVEELFKRNEYSRYRGQPNRLIKPLVRTDQMLNFLPLRVVNE